MRLPTTLSLALKRFLDWVSIWRFARKLYKWTRLTDHLISQDSWQLVYMATHISFHDKERTLIWLKTEIPPEGTEVVNVGPGPL